MAEWLKAPVSKTDVLRGTVGSNPTPSALYRNKLKHRTLAQLVRAHA